MQNGQLEAVFRRPKKAAAFLLLYAAVLCLFFAVKDTSARYVLRHIGRDNIAKAADFYFESPHLKLAEEEYFWEVDSASPLVTQLLNYKDEFRFTADFDIDYTIGITINGESHAGCAIEIYDLEGTLVSNGNSASISGGAPSGHTIIITGLEPFLKNQDAVVVSAQSLSPYRKKLDATLGLESETPSGPLMELNDSGGPYVTLLNSCGGDLILTVPDGLLPDLANPVVQSYENTSRLCEVSSAPGIGYALLFFRKDLNDDILYDLDDFAIIES